MGRPVPGNEGRGCSDHGCVWGHPGGMGTNGGCKCIPTRPNHVTRETLREIRMGVQALNMELRRLRERWRTGDPPRELWWTLLLCRTGSNRWLGTFGAGEWHRQHDGLPRRAPAEWSEIPG